MLCCKQRAGESCPKTWTRTKIHDLQLDISTLVFRTCKLFPFSLFFFVHFCSFFEAVSFHRRGRSLFDDGAPGGPSFFHPCWLGSWFGPSWGRNPSLLRFGFRLCGGEMMGLGDTRWWIFWRLLQEMEKNQDVHFSQLFNMFLTNLIKCVLKHWHWIVEVGPVVPGSKDSDVLAHQISTRDSSKQIAHFGLLGVCIGGTKQEPVKSWPCWTPMTPDCSQIIHNWTKGQKKHYCSFIRKTSMI